MMAAYKKDGTLETWLLLNGAVLSINFLLYTSRQELWPKAATWIGEAFAAILLARRDEFPLEITSLTHQLIDVFIWQGARNEVAGVHLFTEQPDKLPPAVWTAVGRPWYAAHFTNQPIQYENRPEDTLVDFLSVDLSEELGVGWRIRLDHLLEMRFSHPVSPDTLFAQRAPTLLAGKVMDDLHMRNCALLRSLLKPEILTRIGIEPV